MRFIAAVSLYKTKKKRAAIIAKPIRCHFCGFIAPNRQQIKIAEREVSLSVRKPIDIKPIRWRCAY